MSRIHKSRDKQQLGGCQVLGGREEGDKEWLLNVSVVSFKVIKNVLDRGDGSATL